LDLMVGIAQSMSCVVGARMTGGGFGGCTVNLVRKDGLDAFCEKIRSEYWKETQITPSSYVVRAASGAGEIR